MGKMRSNGTFLFHRLFAGCERAPFSRTSKQRFVARQSALYTDDRTLYTDDRLHAQQLRFFNLEKEAPPARGRWPCPDPIDDVINDVILT